MPDQQLPFALGRIATPIGALLLVTDADGRLRAANFADHEARLHRSLRLIYAAGGGHTLRGARVAPALRDAIEAYFGGAPGALAHIGVVTGGTAFQQKVWRALRTIPPGRTETYGAMARRIGCDGAIRAVGAANGANPVSVVVPCHRLVGADGSLIRYGGGLERKRWLLRHEGVDVAPD